MSYIAAEFEFDFNYARMSEELLAIPNDKWLVSKRDDFLYKSVFLTKNETAVFTDFKTAKSILHSEWVWDDSLNISYTRSVIESLPCTVFGIVRVMWTNGPLPMHVDTNSTTPSDLTYRLGVTLAPILHEPMTMLENTLVPGKAVLFDDSVPHGFPKAITDQLGIRIFGEFDYDKFRILRTYSNT
jgi:hypothetical protein